MPRSLEVVFALNTAEIQCQELRGHDLNDWCDFDFAIAAHSLLQFVGQAYNKVLDKFLRSRVIDFLLNRELDSGMIEPLIIHVALPAYIIAAELGLFELEEGADILEMLINILHLFKVDNVSGAQHWKELVVW